MKLTRKKIKKCGILFFMLLICAYCFSKSITRKENTFDIKIMDKETRINDKPFYFIGGTKQYLLQAIGEPNETFNTFGGQDYFYYDPDLRIIVLENNNIETVSFVFYDLKIKNKTDKYEEGSVGQFIIDDLTFTASSTYDIVTSILRKNEIPYSEKKHNQEIGIWISNYRGKDICMHFHKNFSNLITSIAISEAGILAR